MVFDKQDLDTLAEQLRIERLRQRNNPTIQINNRLAELKNNEPSSDKPFFRLAIIGYEFGKTLSSLEDAIVYAERFKQGEGQATDCDKERAAHLKNAQLEIGDCLAQLHLLCLTYGFDYFETRKLGMEHLQERHVDFRHKGWTEIRGV